MTRSLCFPHPHLMMTLKGKKKGKASLVPGVTLSGAFGALVVTKGLDPVVTTFVVSGVVKPRSGVGVNPSS